MQSSLNTLNWTRESISYTGKELSNHWIYKSFHLKGNALVAFQGAADVTLSEMVDLEDVQKKAPIYSPKMLHFIGEWFIDSLDYGILLQHHFVLQVLESLYQKQVSGLGRRGNDLYFQNRKLSVSIATKTPVSVLMHFGINIETEGTPIPTAGLKELQINPNELAEEVLKKMESDSDTWATARVKVLPR